jgi:galactose mutarotase-like enzyme
LTQPILIGGLPIVALDAPLAREAHGLHFRRAVILPGRGAAVLQLKAWLPAAGEIDVLVAPAPEEAAARLDGGPDDFNGNALFSMGAALLVPYANRIRGRRVAGSRTIETEVGGRAIRLPANGGGKAAGAEQYAQHGLLLDRAVDAWTCEAREDEACFRATLDAGDFGWRWPSSVSLAFEYSIRAGRFDLAVTATNVGGDLCPVGIGWHPYFAFPGGARHEARLFVPARKRLLVNDYDEVLPTGVLAPVCKSDYDFSIPGGKALESLFLDDCFVDLAKDSEGHTTCEIVDPLSHYGLRIIARSPEVSAVQVYAPPERPYVAVEPQFNWANPYGAEWEQGTDTGMVVLAPGDDVSYRVSLELFTPP